MDNSKNQSSLITGFILSTIIFIIYIFCLSPINILLITALLGIYTYSLLKFVFKNSLSSQLIVEPFIFRAFLGNLIGSIGMLGYWRFASLLSKVAMIDLMKSPLQNFVASLICIGNANFNARYSLMFVALLIERLKLDRKS
ncbi:MAG: hypothetical protein ABI947_16390 [Chloroflexota bacterium]